MSTTTFKLNMPVQFGERTITELQLRRPKGKDLRKLKGGETSIGDILDIASKLAGEPPAVIDELDGEDSLRLAEVIGDFLGNSRRTGSGA